MEVVLLLKAVSAFVFVIALMYLFSWIMKKTAVANNLTTAKSKARLKIVEFLPVDHSRKLVIIKRDDKEHLLLLGANSETVIETDIKKTGSSKK